MTTRFCYSLPELHLWLREYCRAYLLTNYTIKIEKSKDKDGKITYMIEDRVYDNKR